MSNKLDVEEGVYGLVELPNIEKVVFGTNEITTWYGSAVYFGKDKKRLGVRSVHEKAGRSHSGVPPGQIWLDRLYVCDKCFKYTEVKDEFKQHYLSCSVGQIGKIMYKDEKYTIRKVHGAKHKLYCQCLCLFTKLFLDNKSVFFAVEFFDYYVVFDNGTNKPLGFFSRELLSWEKNNLACVLVFPPYQRRQLGTLLISFSYELSKSERLVSGPETPLSPFGLAGYLKYWSRAICRELMFGDLRKDRNLSISRISVVLGIREDDVFTALKHMRVLAMEPDGSLCLREAALLKWGETNGVTAEPLLRKECLVI